MPRRVAAVLVALLMIPAAVASGQT